MKVKLLVIIVNNCFIGYWALNNTCGVDRSPATVVYEGMADIQTYPWLGVLVFPIDNKPVITTVVLITKQLVIAAATDIDRYPKFSFRERAIVILGHNCSGPRIGIKDYAYHPDYEKSTYSAITIIQLKIGLLNKKLYPICGPPVLFENEQVFAMTVSHECSSTMVRIYKMSYVDSEKCRQFYRKSDLNVESMWPSHFACARGTRGGHCVWQNGAALVMQQNKRWRLLGFGIHGPGCQAPARFLDYGMYYQWVRNSLARIGRPTISRIASNHLILRRSTSTLQRYGECDPEELRTELYTDTTEINYEYKLGRFAEARYNLTLVANVDYNCIVLKVIEVVESSKETIHKPRIHLRRWCTSPHPLGCYDFNLLRIDFFLRITFYGPVIYKVSAYGQEIKLIDGKKVMAYLNRKKNYPAVEKFNSWYEYAKNEFVAG